LDSLDNGSAELVFFDCLGFRFPRGVDVLVLVLVLGPPSESEGDRDGVDLALWLWVESNTLGLSFDLSRGVVVVLLLPRFIGIGEVSLFNNIASIFVVAIAE
jgi:hypothetical protein